MRTSLLSEIVLMAVGTIRTQRMRSGLTILGIVIGITSMVGMTSLILGFDETLRESIEELGPETIFVAQFSGLSLMSGAEFQALLDRPTLTPADARAIERQAPETVASVTVAIGEGGPGSVRSRLSYDGEQTLPLTIVGASQDYPEVFSLTLDAGRFFTEGDVSHRRRVVAIGQGPREALFPNIDPLGRTIRIDNQPYTVIAVIGPRATFGGMDAGQDDIAIIPYSVYQRQYGLRLERSQRGRLQNLLIAVIPREGVTREAAMRDVTAVMRIRHGLRLDDPNDFDLITQDAALRLWEQVSSAVFLALVSISSIALMVGGIGVMAIMTISVKERTREIGTRKAIGARRREILWQFLLEAVFLTAIGGALGIVFGSSIGVAVNLGTGFPVALPWWSFALGIGFSGTVGIVFGIVPAIRASGLDPIEALRYE